MSLSRLDPSYMMNGVKLTDGHTVHPYEYSLQKLRETGIMDMQNPGQCP